MDDLRQQLEDMLSGSFFGLDWGTSASLMASKDSGQSPTVASYTAENRNGIPSLFYRDAAGREYCAEKAKGPGRADPANLCRSIKMKLDGGGIVLNGHSYSPKEIAVKLVRSILKSSRDAFEENFIDFDAASSMLVCGVPVRFNAAKRGQVREILLEATGAPSVRLVSEPILAAVAYNHFLKKQTSQPILCVDIGAGTSDFCVLRKTAGGPEPYEVCPGADGMLVAGDRLDEITAELILERLPKSLDPAIFSDPGRAADYSYFREWQAREMKEALSSYDTYSMPITTVDGSRSGNVTLTRAEFEKRIRPVIMNMVDMAEKVLKAAGLGSKPDIRIQMMGGSCRIPLIRQLLQERFPWVKEIELRNPQQMVALGAALYAEMPVLVQPKVAYGYAVSTHHSTWKREVLDVRIPSDAKLPSVIQGYYATRYDNQTCVTFHIYEVDHGNPGEYLELDQGKKLGGDYFINHDFGRAVPKGTTVLLTTELSTDGVLTMKVDDVSITGQVTKKTFTIANTGTV